MLGQSLFIIICIIGFTSWPGTARLVRAQVLSVKEHQYVERGRGLGASDWYVVTRHVLPNVMPVILANTILTVAIAILSESALSFLGLGDPFNITWGTIIEFAFEAGATSIGAWWWLLAPSIVHRPRRARLHPVRVRVRRDHQPEAARTMSVLSVRDLTVSYSTKGGPVPAVRGVSFDIEKGEVLGLAGESGCGKSTIAGAILRLHSPATKIEGQMLLNDQDILELTPGKLRAVRWTGASIIFQGALHALNPVRKIGDQIAEAITVHNMAGDKEAYVLAGALLEQVGLPPRRIDDFPHELSGGQKQRVMIAMALACSPTLVIADEPTTALDVMVQAQVLQLLRSLQHDLGLAMLFITHDLSVLVEVSDRLAIMYAGLIVEEGKADEVFHSPTHPYTKALAAAFPEIGDTRFRGKPSGLGGDPPDPQHIPSGCPFHPRCAEAVDACSTAELRLWDAGPARRAACIHVSGAPAFQGTT